MGGARFVAASLSGADLSNSDCSKANFTEAILTAATLRGALMPGANLAGLTVDEATDMTELHWDSETVWPAGTAESMSADSDQLSDGSFRVKVGGGSGLKALMS